MLPSGRYRATIRHPGSRERSNRTFIDAQEAHNWAVTELARLREQRKLNELAVGKGAPTPLPADLLSAAMAHLRAAMVLLDAAGGAV
jgi:hypothetical protein